MYSLKVKSKHLCDCGGKKRDECQIPICKSLKKKLARENRYVGIPHQMCLGNLPIGLSNIPLNECIICNETHLWKSLPLEIKYKKFNMFIIKNTRNLLKYENIKPPYTGDPRMNSSNEKPYYQHDTPTPREESREMKYSDRPEFLTPRTNNSATEIKELYNRSSKARSCNQMSNQSVHRSKQEMAEGASQFQRENYCYCPCPYPKLPK